MNTSAPSLDPWVPQTYPGTGFFGVYEHSQTDVGLRLGTLVQFERLGFRIPTAEEALAPGWGLSPESTEFDHRNQYATPLSASEIIRRIDVQRCVNVTPAQIISTGVAFELVHWRVQSGAVCVLEQIPTVFDDVTALDAGGVPYFSFGSLNGERLCRGELIHPDPAVLEPLRWQFSLTYTDDPSRNAPSLIPDMTYLGPIVPQEILGHPITPPWSDHRYGSNNRWAENQQFFAPSGSIVRYWVTLTGPQNRFRVRVGARLGGFQQLGGRRGAALDAVQIRRV